MPDDIAMTGLDNLNITNILGITSMDKKESSVGEEAAKLLMMRLEQSASQISYQDLYFRPELLARESSLGKVIPK